MGTKSKFAKKVSSKVNVFFARWETVSDVVHSDAKQCDKKNRLFEKSRNSTNFYWNSLKFLKVLMTRIMVSVRVCNICKHLKSSDDPCNDQRNVPQCVTWSQILILDKIWHLSKQNFWWIYLISQAKPIFLVTFVSMLVNYIRNSFPSCKKNVHLALLLLTFFANFVFLPSWFLHTYALKVEVFQLFLKNLFTFEHSYSENQILWTLSFLKHYRFVQFRSKLKKLERFKF